MLFSSVLFGTGCRGKTKATFATKETGPIVRTRHIGVRDARLVWILSGTRGDAPCACLILCYVR